MEIRGLMIGDWVLYKDEPITVFEIDEYYDRINTEPDGYNAIRCIEASEIKPIPLTPEILEQNGFIGDKNVCKTKVCDDSKDELWQCEYAWYLKNLRIKNRTNGSVARLYNIMFVHELQHALRLCGIDKEIEI